MPSDHWHKKWTCPFYASSGKTHVACERGSRMAFPNVSAALTYFDRRCASPEMCWKECSIARMLNDYYDKERDK